jgi:hypothetical protein
MTQRNIIGSKRYPETSYYYFIITPRHNPKELQRRFHNGESLRSQGHSLFFYSRLLCSGIILQLPLPFIYLRHSKTYVIYLLHFVYSLCVTLFSYPWIFMKPIPVAARSAAARLLGLRFRIPPGARMSVSCDCCILSGRGPCDRSITRPEESYRLWCVWVWSRNLNDEEAYAH